MKKHYISPDADTIDLSGESIIALSSDNRNTINLVDETTIDNENDFATRHLDNPWGSEWSN